MSTEIFKKGEKGEGRAVESFVGQPLYGVGFSRCTRSDERM